VRLKVRIDVQPVEEVDQRMGLAAAALLPSSASAKIFIAL
jgi:hypothetical protein